MQRMTPIVARFLLDRRGNFAIIGGIVAIGLLGALGGAVDISTQFQSTSRLQSAVDAAVLAAAKKLMTDIDAPVEDEIRMMVLANVPEDLKDLRIDAVVDKVARTVRVETRGEIPTTFLPLLRIDDLGVGAIAVSSITREHFTDFYVLLDVSESMNLAASDADRIKLEALTARWMRLKPNGVGERLAEDGRPRTCAFACHQVESNWSNYSIFDMNRLEGQSRPENMARLRIDVVREATKTMISKILGQNSNPVTLWRTRVATAFFSEKLAWGVKKPSDKFSDLEKTLVAEVPPVKSAHTHFREAFEDFNKELGLQRDGSTQNEAEKVAIVITDGVSDRDNWSTGTLDTNFCSAIKAKKIKLAILEIKYLKIEDRYGYFRGRVDSFYNKISPALKNCASDNLYYMATDADQAASKLVEMTRALLPPANHLSQ